MLFKAIEFTAVYASNTDNDNKLDGFKISDPWQQLRKIRISIGKKCNWIEERNQTSLYESVKWLQSGPYLSANNPRKVFLAYLGIIHL